MWVVLVHCVENIRYLKPQQENNPVYHGRHTSWSDWGDESDIWKLGIHRKLPWMFWTELAGIRFDCPPTEDAMKFGTVEICPCGIITNWFPLTTEPSCIVEVWAVLLETISLPVLEVFTKFKGESLVLVIWEFIGTGWHNVAVGTNTYVGALGLQM